MATAWNAGKACRLYSRRQWGYIKYNVGRDIALDMAKTTLDQGVSVADLPALSGPLTKPKSLAWRQAEKRRIIARRKLGILAVKRKGKK